MFFLFIFGASLTVTLFVLFNMDGETIITVNSKYGLSLSNSNISKAYVAKRKNGKNGNDSADWDYYNDAGDMINNQDLIGLKFLQKTYILLKLLHKN